MAWKKGEPLSREHIEKRSRTISENGKRHKRSRIVDDVEVWKCSTCAEWKGADNYHKDKRTPNGLKAQCKVCHSKSNLLNRDPSKHRVRNQRAESQRRGRKAMVHIRQITKNDWCLLREILGERCLCCDDTGKIQWDHIVPLSKGGAHHPANLQPLCRRCNEIKQARSRDYRSGQQREKIEKVWVIEFKVV